MAIYVHLAKITQQGAINLRDHSSVYAAWNTFADSIGASVICAVACFGDYDYVVVCDYPDQTAALKGAGYASVQGMVQSQTLPACPVEDFFKAMSELPS